MEGILFCTSLSLIFILFTFKFLFQTKTRRHKNLPPSPPSLPILGHLHLLKHPVHQTFRHISKKYGRVFSLWFGSRRVVIVSCASAVEECFTKNDIVLANRPLLLMGKHLGYNNTTMAGSPYGHHWRNLRRIGATEIFSNARLHLFSDIRKDEVKHLLNNLSRNARDHFAKVMLLAGTDTSAVTLEWAMSNLLNHPHVLTKVRAELDAQLGQENIVDEPDISKLPYLQSIISETLRLCLAAPLLVPHLSCDDCKIGGFDVPRDTLVLVNAWALHRDPELWDDPESFKPERFESGEDLSDKLMPFGLGRRACPGSGLAQRVVGLTLGSLIQCFEWERVTEQEVDMTEGKGLTMPKAVSLEAICRARSIVSKVLS